MVLLSHLGSGWRAAWEWAGRYEDHQDWFIEKITPTVDICGVMSVSKRTPPELLATSPPRSRL